MSEPSLSENAGAFGLAVKVFGSPAFIGIIAGALGFLWSWPRTAREGFVRIAAAGVCSHFFGPGLLKTALHFAPWFVPEDISAGCYLIAGLPGWWILAWVFRWLEARRDKPLEDVAADIVEGAKHIREIV